MGQRECCSFTGKWRTEGRRRERNATWFWVCVCVFDCWRFINFALTHVAGRALLSCARSWNKRNRPRRRAPKNRAPGGTKWCVIRLYFVCLSVSVCLCATHVFLSLSLSLSPSLYPSLPTSLFLCSITPSFLAGPPCFPLQWIYIVPLVVVQLLSAYLQSGQKNGGGGGK